MSFKASFLELALAYGLSAYMFGGLCVFGCTWHNVPASALSLAGMFYFAVRTVECVSAWLTVKWQEMFAEDRPIRGRELRPAFR